MCSLIPAMAAAAAAGELQRNNGYETPPESLAMVIYDPVAAAERLSVDGGGVPYVAPPIDAVPLAFAAPPRRMVVVGDVPPVEPWWIRQQLLPDLCLRLDLPVHYIGAKAVTVTDLDPHQNRFRIPNDVSRKLCPILSAAELDAANLLLPDLPRPPKKVNAAAAAADQLQAQGGIKKKRGKKHGGLPVMLVNDAALIRKMTLARWESNRGTVVKGEGYIKFIEDSGFKVGDMVDIWAFKHSEFRLMGFTVFKQKASSTS